MNKTIGLDAFYIEIQSLIAMIKGYTEIKHLDTIIKMCRLKPYSLLFGKENKKLQKHWIDEFGNSVHIDKKDKWDNKRQFKIVANDLLIDQKQIISTDLYDGLSLHRTYLMSKLGYFIIGKEKVSYQKHYIISLLGIDDFLRTFVYLDGKWLQYPSLLLGLDLLRNIVCNKEMQSYRKTNYKKMLIRPCVKRDAWLTSLPMEEELIKMLPDDLVYNLTQENK